MISIHLLAILCCVLVLACVFGQAYDIVKECIGTSGRRWSTCKIFTFCILLVFFAVLILRPHQDTFQGLDASAYRLMAKALENGRPLKGVDETLKEVPPDVRKWLLLSPNEPGRITRDRSFELESLDSCQTKPFFYPFLPLCMVGFDAMLPGRMLDYFVPFLALIFCAVCLFAGTSRGGIAGTFMSLALLLGSPLPAWLFRGCHLEVVSGILIALTVLAWVLMEHESRALSAFQFLALGLAVSFHPVTVVLAVPLFGIILLDTAESPLLALRDLLVFVLGLMPLVLFTLFIAQPYGAISQANFTNALINNSSIRPTLICCGILCVIVVTAFTFRKALLGTLSLDGWKNHAVSCVLFLAWTIPTFLAMKFWENGQQKVVCHGMKELLDGLQIPLGTGLLILCAYAGVSRKCNRARIAMTVVFMSLPLFLYLKGAETMGLWSQRRLIASLLTLFACLLPFAASLVGRATRRGKLWILRVTAMVISLGVIGFYNFVRWPAPYLVQYDKGADAWVESLSTQIGGKFAVFDYYHYSVPFAALDKVKALGLSEGGNRSISAISTWLAEKAKSDDVLLITAFHNPGMEDGVVLDEVSHQEVGLERAHSKTSLPAEKTVKNVDVRVLKAHPANTTNALVVNKILDNGPLALRGPWGASRQIKVDGRLLPARWSREGSGIIGPLPLPGSTVKIQIEGEAARDDGVEMQILRIVPALAGWRSCLGDKQPFYECLRSIDTSYRSSG